MGVWIEIEGGELQQNLGGTSLPAWECGLKLKLTLLQMVLADVTPCVGVWIEILKFDTEISEKGVTPCVGVWIEIQHTTGLHSEKICHSLRGSVD